MVMANGSSLAVKTGTRGSGRGSGQAHYDVGSRVLCFASFDRTQRVADVVDKRENDAGITLYYVHYCDFDKRLDEWVAVDKMQRYSSSSLPDSATPRLASLPSISSDVVMSGSDQKMTRRLKRRFDEIHHVTPDVNNLAPIDQHLEKEHQEKTKVKNVQVVELGRYEMDTWYYSPYPEPYASSHKLYLCEYCLKYFNKKKTLLRHAAKCDLRHPPGDEIYRSPPKRSGEPHNPAFMDPTIAVFEVDGKKNKIYCQSLCLLSKLFLDHKTLYYDVDPFLFYILCEQEHGNYHIVGYFSKEKNSIEGYNLACILTLPPYQRKGYGRLLIAFSYELSKKEGKLGTPERPLSDLGQVSYRSYWTRVLLDALREHKGNMAIKDLSEATAVRSDDVVRTLESLNCIKYWKGDHIIAATPRIIEEHLRSIENQKTIGIEVSRLHWTPYVLLPRK